MKNKYHVFVLAPLVLSLMSGSVWSETSVDDKKKSTQEIKDKMKQSLDGSTHLEEKIVPKIDKDAILLEAKNDLCLNIGGKQTDIPPGRFRITDTSSKFFGWCVIKDINNIHIVEHEDMCKNLDGIQYVIPSGYFDEGGKQCFVDACINIEGNQKTIPASMRDANIAEENLQNGVNMKGICVDKMKYSGWFSGGDWCVNIEGKQFNFPPGTLANHLGECEIDKCLNIPGLQTVVPLGHIYDSKEQLCIPIDSGAGDGNGDGDGYTGDQSDGSPSSGVGSGGGGSGDYYGP